MQSTQPKKNNIKDAINYYIRTQYELPHMLITKTKVYSHDSREITHCKYHFLEKINNPINTVIEKVLFVMFNPTFSTDRQLELPLSMA